MIRHLLGYGKQAGGLIWDLSPNICDVPDSTWPEPTRAIVRAISDRLISQLPEGTEHPEILSLRELAGLAIPPTFEDLPEETKALVEEISPGYTTQQR